MDIAGESHPTMIDNALGIALEAQHKTEDGGQPASSAGLGDDVE